MKRKDWLYWLLVLIAASTFLTGALQAIKPAFILRLLSAETTITSRHFFAIVGMFMVLFGGATLHALFSFKHHPVVILWSSLQKFGASVAVALGVQRGVFASLALVVAIIDFLSGVLAIWYWSRIRRES
ncbi:MAG: patatin [bacterium]